MHWLEGKERGSELRPGIGKGLMKHLETVQATRNDS